MYHIKEISEKLKIPANAIRFYEKKGLLKPERGKSGYREYTLEDMNRLEQIQLYRKMDFSIEAIRELLAYGETEGKEKQQRLLEQYVLQYNLLNQHIHVMTQVRNALGESVEELLKEKPDEEKILNQMEQTVTKIDVANGWRDNWDFDNWASNYDRDIRTEATGLDFYKNYDEVLRFTAEKAAGKKIVEIGIGTGNLAKVIREKYMSLETYIGVDQSVNMLKEAKKKCQGVTLRLGDFLKLPLESASYDCVVTSYAFHHCNQQEKELAIAEMDRILSAGGRIVITDLMFWNQQARDAFVQQASVREKEDLEDEYFGNVVELTNTFEKYGYQCETKQIDKLIWCIVAKK